MIDWLEDFEKSFGGHQLISRLGELRFHGKVEINFNEGKPLAANLQMFCKAGTQINMTVISLEEVNEGVNNG